MYPRALVMGLDPSLKKRCVNDGWQGSLETCILDQPGYGTVLQQAVRTLADPGTPVTRYPVLLQVLC
jgi:hypothetical protein